MGHPAALREQGDVRVLPQTRPSCAKVQNN